MITPKRPQTFVDRNDDKYGSIARRIFERKTLKKYYEVFLWELFGDDWQDDGCSHYVPLSDEQVDFLRNLLQEHDEDLYELEEEIPFYEKLTDEHSLINTAPKSIDLDHPVHFYSFHAVIMETKDSQPKKVRFRLLLSDEEYLYLLKWRLQNRGSSFNSLSKENPALFCRLTSKTTWCLGEPFLGWEIQSPFLVFMDEVDQDVFDEVGEPDFNDQVFEDLAGNRNMHTVLDIKEKVLTFFLEDVDEYLVGTRKYIEDVDAVAVQKALGATCYKEVYEKMKEYYGKDLSGFDLFKQFLDDHSIAYKYSENIS